LWVITNLFHHDGKLYMLLSFVVMPNHVHVLLRPLQEGMDPLVGDQTEDTAQAQDQEQAGKPAPQYVPLRRITQSLKGYTAREANRLLQRTGLTFWQDESYDHWARDESEIERIALYIESDPVRAGLTASPEQWRWSSAWEREWGRLRESRADSTVCPEAS
jgi:putative DNA methylase